MPFFFLFLFSHSFLIISVVSESHNISVSPFLGFWNEVVLFFCLVRFAFCLITAHLNYAVIFKLVFLSVHATQPWVAVARYKLYYFRTSYPLHRDFTSAGLFINTSVLFFISSVPFLIFSGNFRLIPSFQILIIMLFNAFRSTLFSLYDKFTDSINLDIVYSQKGIAIPSIVIPVLINSSRVNAVNE